VTPTTGKRLATEGPATTAATEPTSFDLAGPLPEGLTLLEASAGTGKTFAIAALVARYVAEGLDLDELLVVTFTRAATGELRDRVRQRLVSSLHALDRHLAADTDGTDTDGTDTDGTGSRVDEDPVNAVLAAGARVDVERRRDHLAAALAEFDRATIVTTHAFCNEVLQGLGTAGDVARDVTFLEDDHDLLGEVVDDFYVRKFARQARRAEFSHRSAGEIAAAATRTPGLDLEPQAAPPGSEADLRYRFATNVRLELTRRKQRANAFSYDDVLRALADSLQPADGIAAARLRERFKVVLVDEFQDTDPTQWQILESAFLRPGPRPGAALILVGDPKQAIYSFRGADVYTYLHAAEQASRQTMGVNWRSDQGLIEAVDALLDGAALGHPGIRCRPVSAAPGHDSPSLVGPGAVAPVRVRVVAGDDPRLTPRLRGGATVDSIRAVIAEDLAADVVGFLASGTDIVPAEGGPRPVVPGDLAVLVRTNRAAATVRRALEAVGVPAVIHGGENVFATPVALHWLQLLEALERPASAVRARAASLSDFVGWDPARLAAAPDSEIGALQARLHEWAGILERQGVGALIEAITLSTRLPVRLLSQPGGERRLTDLQHIGELLHAEAAAGHLGPAALAAWLRRRMEEGEQTPNAEERSRRLESDAEAVAVLTIHRSKGLEFPVVYLPDLSEPEGARGLPTYHDPDTGRRTLEVGRRDDPDNPDYQRHWNLYEEEQRGEELRRAYVALTRARHQVVLWWGPFQYQSNSPLTRLLMAQRDPGGAMLPRAGSTEPAVRSRLAALAARTGGRLAVESVTPTPSAGRWQPLGTPSAGELSVRQFDRALDVGWRRTSYTALTVGAHRPGGEAAVGSEAEDAPLDDELPVEPTAPLTEKDSATEAALRAEPSPMAGLGKGRAFGVLVHAVLEAVAFDDPDLEASLASAIRTSTRFGRAGAPAAELAAALTRVITTPLGPGLRAGGPGPWAGLRAAGPGPSAGLRALGAGELRLRDVARADRLDELAFELPLSGGDTPGPRVGLGDVAQLLRSRLEPSDPLAAYADRLDDPATEAVLRGYLTGSIDLLLRVRGDGEDRFVVVDYKTNWLAPPGEELSGWHYRPAAMADAMIQAHYPLQALLYSVALHRYLRWRLPSYTPERNLGGILYLFIRGMSGPETPRVDGSPCGVFSWQPPPGLVTDLSDLLDGHLLDGRLLNGRHLPAGQPS
jgi:exodeoxyribonuclease V beta subunit